MLHRINFGSHATNAIHNNPVEARFRKPNLSRPNVTTASEPKGPKSEPTHQPDSEEVPKSSSELPMYGPQNKPNNWPHDKPQADPSNPSGAQLGDHSPSRLPLEPEGHGDNRPGSAPLARPEEHLGNGAEDEPNHAADNEQEHGAPPQSAYSPSSSGDTNGYLSDLGRSFADGLVSTGLGMASDAMSNGIAEPQEATPNYSNEQHDPTLDGPENQDGEEDGEDPAEQDDGMDPVDNDDGTSVGRYDDHESTEYHPEHNEGQEHSDSYHAGYSYPGDLYHHAVDAYAGERSDHASGYVGDGFDEQSGYGYDNYYYGDDRVDAW